METSRAPRRSTFGAGRLGAVIVLALLVGVSALLLRGPMAARDRVPPAAEVEAVARTIGEGFEPGDVVRIHPWWYTGPRGIIGERLPEPEVPYRLPFDLSAPPDLLHLLRHDRVWLVQAYDALTASPETLLGAPLPVTLREEHPHVALTRLDVPDDAIRYDLLRSVGEAVVRRGERPCPWNEQARRHRCGEQPWKDVYPTLKEVGDATRPCIYVEPHPANTVVSITWPAVPMEGTLVVHTGFSIEGARRTAGADTRLRLLVGGEPVAEWTEPKNEFVWRETRVAGDGETRPVTIELSTPAIGWRQLCIDGAVVRDEYVSWL